MKVLKATQEQYEQLNGFIYGPNKLEFVKDGAGNWIVGLEVLDNGSFIDLREDLDELERIDYVPDTND